MTTTLLALAVTGAIYDLDWQGDGLHFTGTVDTTTDVLTINSWQDEHPTRYPLRIAEWPALYAEEGVSHQYDIPDDWDGTINEWGFITETPPPDRTGPLWDAGLGCQYDGFEQYQQLECTDSLVYLMHWPFRRCDDIGTCEWMPSWPLAQRIDITPVSPSRAVGDVNLDARFDSSDMVQVFSIGLYEADSPAGWPDGDWTGDGLFSSADMVAAFVGGAYEQQVSVVPEPSAVVLLLLGLVAMRKRR